MDGRTGTRVPRLLHPFGRFPVHESSACIGWVGGWVQDLGRRDGCDATDATRRMRQTTKVHDDDGRRDEFFQRGETDAVLTAHDSRGTGALDDDDEEDDGTATNTSFPT